MMAMIEVKANKYEDMHIIIGGNCSAKYHLYTFFAFEYAGGGLMVTEKRKKRQKSPFFLSSRVDLCCLTWNFNLNAFPRVNKKMLKLLIECSHGWVHAVISYNYCWNISKPHPWSGRSRTYIKIKHFFPNHTCDG